MLPKSELSSSPESDGEFAITAVPTASALVDMTAIAASPLVLPFSCNRSRKNAAIATIGSATYIGCAPSAYAIAIAAKPTCESPSPIIEYLFNTRFTPSSAAQSDTAEPTANTRNNIPRVYSIAKSSVNVSSICGTPLPYNTCLSRCAYIRARCQRNIRRHANAVCALPVQQSRSRRARPL